jgi:hypothetical protein
MQDLLVEVSALKVVLTHALAKLPRSDLKKMSEDIQEELQTIGEGGATMAAYRVAVDDIISKAASLSR